MHPVKHLFEDIYRNYWGISPASDCLVAFTRTMNFIGILLSDRSIDWPGNPAG